VQASLVEKVDQEAPPPKYNSKIIVTKRKQIQILPKQHNTTTYYTKLHEKHE